MRILEFGDQRLHLDATAVRQPHLQRFVDRVSIDTAPAPVRHQMRIVEGEEAELLVDEQTGSMSLVVPSMTTVSPTVLEIAILQAGARCLALLGTTDRFVLLHGSAVTATDGGGAVAVLDGGVGQGKTSLALGLAKAGCALLVDEFTFVTCDRDEILVAPAPRLPWHVRGDMAPYLAPEHPGRRLLFPDQLAPVGTAKTAASLALIVVPDSGIPAGKLEQIDPAQTGALLTSAVTDHVAKLIDPRLDHVSIFSKPSQVRYASGHSLLNSRAQLCTPHRTVLDRLSRIPTFRVGIGSPADLAASVEAVTHVVESL
ncbi:hypothetical protein [Micromonospora craniellae]|uniref:Serine kinase n=1 Tax=Micromonospora craniellae TaxID=2294034 RepID=A0A372FRF6_9ACTN|nr:hypothetical protein [Micromonospora craniellae]QOC90852.1 hypothetical protein ID554_22555 [Micromonospora craniellae]RFS41556.1 hypothetical protein D0Q02_29510 [Micromonospora craniellae]